MRHRRTRPGRTARRGWSVHVVLAVSALATFAGCPDEGEEDPAPDSSMEASDGAASEIFVPDTAHSDSGADAPANQDVGSLGDFGVPCLSNSECSSGWCVASEQGPVCTKTCLDDCPEGWGCVGVKNTGQDITFICVPKSNQLCAPCLSDSQCGDGNCHELADGSYCSRPCADDDPCPGGFTCTEIQQPDTALVNYECLPDTGGCSCSTLNDGEARPCEIENEAGRCLGTETCEGSVGWGACSAATPAPEACDGVDNDCDGVADDDPAAPEEPCVETSEAGTCAGVWSCAGLGGWVCSAPTPVAEACDQADNDCDGAVDEDFTDPDSGALVHPSHCGACGADCTIANAITACELVDEVPTCVIEACTAGYYPAGPATCLPLQSSLCLACVDDAGCGVAGDLCLPLGDGSYCGRSCAEGSIHGTECPPGYTCEQMAASVAQCLPTGGACDCLPQNAGVMKSCSVANEDGACFGSQVCSAESGWSDCGAPTPALEVCDGADNDCDGVVDEDLPAPDQPCESTWEDPESDATATCAGSWSCAATDGSTAWVCNAPVAGPEACDYQDNDCDGEVDEDFRLGGDGPYDHPEHCGICGLSCLGAIPNATAKCDTSGLTPACVVDTCAEGYYAVAPTACLPIADPSCQPCVTDAGCGLPGNRCLELDGSTRCARTCGDPNPYGAPGACPAGYLCEETAPGEQHCVPAGGSCTCVTDEDDGETRPCVASSVFGACAGVEECALGVGWSPCDAAEPAAESCNGLDDDCDGQADEGLSTPDDPCESQNDAGTCTGAWTCEGLAGWSCSAAEPAVEICDGIDNDCSGQADDPFRDEASGLYVHDAHCGACGNGCQGAVPFATETTCQLVEGKPTCVAAACEEGFGLSAGPLPFCLPEAGGFDCSPCVTATHCAALDGGQCVSLDGASHCVRACDGGACSDGYACTEGACLPVSGSCTCLPGDEGETRACFEVNEAGACFGTQTCDPAQSPGWTACTATVPEPEDCDGVDNDCDGGIDEGLLPDPAACTITSDEGSCTAPVVCAGDGGWLCTATTPGAESCDLLDNDCDDLVDEDYRVDGVGAYVHDQHCGACGVSCAGAIPNATATCKLHEGQPRCEVAECAAGFFQVGPLTCLPVAPSLCQPCQTDANCPTPGDRCLALDGAGYCGRDCGPANLYDLPAGECPAGYACDAAGAPGAAPQCVPVSGSCSCMPTDVGATRPCSKSGTAGTCFGEEICNPAEGWSPCSAQTPTTEVCDEADTDCDGLVDDVEGRGTACAIENEHGECVGILDCDGSGPALVCVGPVPAIEVCNGVDDDCDGTADEGFAPGGVYSLDAHCGACGNDCTGAFANGTGACVVSGGGPHCEVSACDPGFVPLGESQCVPAELGLCDPCVSSASCLVPGAACAPLDDGTFCLNPCTGDDACPEGFACEPLADQGSFCTPETDACQCDGTNDQLQKGCKVTFAPEGGQPYQCFGVQTCGPQGWSECGLPAEDCNQLDDDCDGEVDEDFVTATGGYTTDEHCGGCGNDCTLLVFPGGAGSCNTFVDPPVCSLSCSGDCFDVNANPSDGCECCDPQPEDFPDPEGDDANCDGMDGEKDNGIFVAKDGDDLLNDGTWGHPKRSIQAGIGAATELGKRDVYVATGVYEEQVSLAAGVAVYGGYSSDFAVRDPLLYEAAILSPPGTAELPGAVSCLSISGGAAGSTVFDGFGVFAADVTGSSASSYGVYLRDCDASVRVSNNRVHAGRGGDGDRGDDGESGDDGNPGTDGMDALDLLSAYQVDDHDCAPANHSPGGAPGSLECDGMDVSGGIGGERVCPALDPATGDPAGPSASEAGEPGKGGGASGGAAGWDTVHQAYKCLGFATFGILEGENGQDGGGGDHGVSGAGCSDSAGAVQGGVWVPAGANGGTAGTHAAGGGGGGSGAGAWVHESCYAKGFGRDNLGGTGGGGGSGGCGGEAGTAGTSAGGSFAIFVTFTAPPTSLPTVEYNQLHAGRGGNGGDGGNAGTGGAGGAGGFGGAEGGNFIPADPTYPAYEGGKGGKGGNGGHAGGGGGGCGGPSFGLFVHGAGALTPASWADANPVVTEGIGGPGGFGGFSLGAPGTPGSPGVVADTNLPPP